MSKFKLAVDKQFFVDGVLVSLKAGEHETTDKELIEKLKNAKNVTEVKAAAKKAKEQHSPERGFFAKRIQLCQGTRKLKNFHLAILNKNDRLRLEIENRRK